MPSKKTKPRKTEKPYHLKLSLASTLLLGGGIFFLLAWIFVLGILVGRGFFPERVKTLSKLRRPIVKLQGMVGNRKPSDLDFIKKLDKDPKFEFFEELSIKKGQMAQESHSNKKKVGGQTIQDTGGKLSGSEGEFTVQIASLDDEMKAARMAERLTKSGYQAYFYKANVRGKPYFRVRCGRFKTRDEASDLIMLLAKQQKIKGFITRVEE